jgi:riboflavin kinase/FMN adenylyltransferase
MSWTLQDLSELPERLRGAYVVVGNFDGVHRGHQNILQRAAKLAALDERPVVAITFDPHPRTVLAPREPFLQLTDKEEKYRLLKEAGADEVVPLAFDTELASLSPVAFVEQILARHFEAKAIVASRNFRFGKDRAGTIIELAEIAPRMGMMVDIIPPAIFAENDEVITAAAVRSRLALGDVKTANHLLGHRWTVEGFVVHGDKRGRQLGFPTANLGPINDIRFGFGIYAVRVLLNGKIANGVACYGTRPQFDDGAPRIEIHLLDFAGDIYGERLLVEFVAFQRSERTFASVDALKQQIDRDCLTTRRLLSTDFEELEIDSVLNRRALTVAPPSACVRRLSPTTF